MTFTPTALVSVSLGDQAYNALVEALMKGALHGGDRIRIQEIAKKLGTSVTPVRDAVLRLVQDEALVMRNARDIRVPSIAPEQYLEIRNVRLELEGLAAEQAAMAATSADIARLGALLRDDKAANERHDYANLAALNQAFHTELANIGGAPILLGVLRRLWTRTGPFIADAYRRGHRIDNEQHYAILQTLIDHDPRQARAAVHRDILEGSNAVLDAFRVETEATRGGGARAAKATPRRSRRAGTAL